MQLFILYQLLTFTKASRSYKAYDVYDSILGKDVPIIVLMHNLDLFKRFFRYKMVRNEIKCQETRLQAVINEFVECFLRQNGVGKKIDYNIGLAFFNL